MKAPKLWTWDGHRLTMNLNAAQGPTFTTEARYVALVSGTGAGKTSMIPLWLMVKGITEHPGTEHMVVAPNFAMLNSNVMPKMKEFFEDALKIAVHRKVDRYYQLDESVGGGRIWLRSADKPETLEGLHAQTMCLDEAGQMDGMVWDVALRRVGQTGGRILITSTPYEWNWLKHEVQDPFEAGDKDFFVVNADSTVNPAYPKAEFEKRRKHLEEIGQGWKFKMMYQGLWARPEGLIVQVPDDCIVDRFDIPRDWPVKTGLDWGVNDPTACLWAAEAPDGTAYIFKEWKQPGLMPEESAAVVAGMTGEMRVVSWGADGNGIGATVWINKFREAGMPVMPVRTTVLAGISMISELFASRRLKIFRDCRMLLQELGQWSWKTRRVGTKEREIIDQPMGKDDHLASALRYLCQAGYTVGDVPAELEGAMMGESRWGGGGAGRWKGRAR